MKRLYILKTPTERLIIDTIAYGTKGDCWAKAFDHVAFDLGEQWKWRFWKKWAESLKSAQRNGYKIVPCDVVELK